MTLILATLILEDPSSTHGAKDAPASGASFAPNAVCIELGFFSDHLAERRDAYSVDIEAIWRLYGDREERVDRYLGADIPSLWRLDILLSGPILYLNEIEIIGAGFFFSNVGLNIHRLQIMHDAMSNTNLLSQ